MPKTQLMVGIDLDKALTLMADPLIPSIIASSISKSICSGNCSLEVQLSPDKVPEDQAQIGFDP